MVRGSGLSIDPVEAGIVDADATDSDTDGDAADLETTDAMAKGERRGDPCPQESTVQRPGQRAMRRRHHAIDAVRGKCS